MESCILGLCCFYGHFWGMGRLLRACELSIWLEIFGAGLGMLKHKTRRVSDFLGHIYTTCNFISLFSSLAFSQNRIQDFFHYFMWKRRVFSPKKEKKRQTLFLDDNYVFVANVTNSHVRFKFFLPFSQKILFFLNKLLRPVHTSDWIATIPLLADWHELLATEPLATECSNTQLLWIGKDCVHLFVKGGKMMKSCQISATTCSNERSSRCD